jgi:SAM-dependent methyltransferase
MRYSGRLKIIEKLGSKIKFSLNVGSKETTFGSINLDIKPSATTHVVGDARKLPFKSQIFELVYFTDVVEHLPKGEEIIALKEISRVLGKNGELVLSTPNNRLLFTFLDPAFWTISHRHYTHREIIRLLEKTGFEISIIFSSGCLWACIGNLWYCLIIYPLKRIFKRNFLVPPFIRTLEDKEYDFQYKYGYTIFVKARKGK